MNAYYIAPESTVEEYKALIHAGKAHPNVHWLHTLPDQQRLPYHLCLVVVRGDEGAMNQLESLWGVEPLPLIMDGQPLDHPARQKRLLTHHKDVLNAIGVDPSQHTALDMAFKAARIHGKFRPTGA